ncbi:MAG: sodium:solute symporter family protein [Candidatus Neomarinimicrobiota bacterium]
MTPIRLAPVDLLVIAVYLVAVLLLGLKYSRRYRGDIDGYLLAGRKLSLPAFIATLVATWYGGILGIGEFTYRYGLLNWVTQGLPYYLFAILFGVFLAPRIQRSGLYTIPDQLYQRYGKPAGLLGSFFIFFLTNPAPHLLMVALLVSAIFGIPFWWAFSIGVLFSILYAFFGGLRSVVVTDIFQFGLMFLGFGILAIKLVTQYGGLTFLQANLPADHLRFSGGAHWQFILVWFFIAFWTFVDPGFYQRCYAARSPQTARRGVLISVIFWLLFDMLTTTSGLYARALLHDINPLMAFPRLGEMVLTDFWRGLFFVSLLATIMSTLDSISLLSAMTFGRDLMWRIKPDSPINRNTRIGFIFTIVLSALVILFIPSVVKIWYTLGTLFIPGLLIPIICNFSPLKFNSGLMFAGMLFSFLGTLAWFIAGIVTGSASEPVFPLNLQPFFAGLSIWIFFLPAAFRHSSTNRAG